MKTAHQIDRELSRQYGILNRVEIIEHIQSDARAELESENRALKSQVETLRKTSGLKYSRTVEAEAHHLMVENKALRERAEKAEAALHRKEWLLKEANKPMVGVWCWQGDGEDHLESLTCPVLISADDMRRVVLAKEKAEAAFSELRSVLDAPAVIRAYDKMLKAHPMYKRFIEHTPFENDCAAIAWESMRGFLPIEECGKGWCSPEEKAKLEACCAEMRYTIQDMSLRIHGSYDWNSDPDGMTLKESHALSSDCGQGWCSPEEVTRIVGEIQKLQPLGSPIPGDTLTTVQWIVRTVITRMKAMEEILDVWVGHTCVADGKGGFVGAQNCPAHRWEELKANSSNFTPAT